MSDDSQKRVSRVKRAAEPHPVMGAMMGKIEGVQADVSLIKADMTSFSTVVEKLDKSVSRLCVAVTGDEGLKVAGLLDKHETTASRITRVEERCKEADDLLRVDHNLLKSKVDSWLIRGATVAAILGGCCTAFGIFWMVFGSAIKQALGYS